MLVVLACLPLCTSPSAAAEDQAMPIIGSWTFDREAQVADMYKEGLFDRSLAEGPAKAQLRENLAQIKMDIVMGEQGFTMSTGGLEPTHARYKVDKVAGNETILIADVIPPEDEPWKTVRLSVTVTLLTENRLIFSMKEPGALGKAGKVFLVRKEPDSGK